MAAKAEKQLVGITKEEFVSWRQHPCSKALDYTLEAELDRLVLEVVNGVFVSDTAEASALRQAHAVGASATLKYIEDYVSDMLENSQTDEDIYEKALRTPQG